MAWITLTEDHLKTLMAGPEWTALTNAVLSAGQTAEALVTEALDDTTKRVLGYVGACPDNRLGPEGTIPDELKHTALVIARARLFTRLPGLKSLHDEIRQKEYDGAVDELRSVASCKFAIVQPDVVGEEQPGGAEVQVVRHRGTVAQRGDTSGLM